MSRSYGMILAVSLCIHCVCVYAGPYLKKQSALKYETDSVQNTLEEKHILRCVRIFGLTKFTQ